MKLNRFYITWCYNRQCVAFVNRNATYPHTGIVSSYIPLNSGLWSNLLRKTAIKANFYFPSEEENVCLRKILVSVNSMGGNLDATFL